jgi:hypothetical protein
MEALMIAATSIRENMEVLGSDGTYVGTVEHVDHDEVRLASDNAEAGGAHHYIPRDWIVHVEMKVHLNQTGDEARLRWTTH